MSRTTSYRPEGSIPEVVTVAVTPEQRDNLLARVADRAYEPFIRRGMARTARSLSNIPLVGNFVADALGGSIIQSLLTKDDQIRDNIMRGASGRYGGRPPRSNRGFYPAKQAHLKAPMDAKRYRVSTGRYIMPLQQRGSKRTGWNRA